jgi:hypothetical protein
MAEFASRKHLDTVSLPQRPPHAFRDVYQRW